MIQPLSTAAHPLVVVPSPEATFELLQAMQCSAASDPIDSHHDERRITERTYVFKPIVLQPLNDELQASGEAIQALSRDVTLSGIGWISTVPISVQYLSIDLFPDTHESRCVIVRVAHQFQSGPLYLGGGAVVVDWQ